MIFSQKISRSLSGVFFISIVALCCACPAQSQVAPPPSYDVTAEAPAVKENYSESTKIATNRAMRKSVQNALLDLLGDSAYADNQEELKPIISRSHRYVRNYRYIEAQDDPVNKVSRVKIEVSLYIDALRKQLARQGILSVKTGKRSVVILIKETSFISRENASSWDYIPISEVALGQSFIEAGIQTVDRGSIVDLISDEEIDRAARGDVSAAVDIGLKTGYDVIIVGNAVSSLLGGKSSAAFKTIQANLSLKVVSTNRSAVIAAKSDFATVKTTEEIKGELQAFESVSDKLSGFLVDAVRRFWDPKPHAKASPRPALKPLPLPGTMDDL